MRQKVVQQQNGGRGRDRGTRVEKMHPNFFSSSTNEFGKDIIAFLALLLCAADGREGI
jgi:hypothetical protein